MRDIAVICKSRSPSVKGHGSRGQPVRCRCGCLAPSLLLIAKAGLVPSANRSHERKAPGHTGRKERRAERRVSRILAGDAQQKGALLLRRHSTVQDSGKRARRGVFVREPCIQRRHLCCLCRRKLFQRATLLGLHGTGNAAHQRDRHQGGCCREQYCGGFEGTHDVIPFYVVLLDFALLLNHDATLPKAFDDFMTYATKRRKAGANGVWTASLPSKCAVM